MRKHFFAMALRLNNGTTRKQIAVYHTLNQLKADNLQFSTHQYLGSFSFSNPASYTFPNRKLEHERAILYIDKVQGR